MSGIILFSSAPYVDANKSDAILVLWVATVFIVHVARGSLPAAGG
jgi:hypothetical protein